MFKDSTKSANDQLSATTLKIEGTAEDEKGNFPGQSLGFVRFY
jgi:hypothetical protein